MSGKQRRLGLVGGLAPPSTVDYYERIITEWRRHNPETTPLMLIDSLDPDRALYLVGNDRAGFVDYLSGSIDRLTRGGVDLIAIAANTPHLVFDDLAARAEVPMVSIVEACAREAVRLELRNVGLIGTRFTMDSRFYPDVFERHGISIVVPMEDERRWIHEHYVGEFLRGEFRDEVRLSVISIVDRMKEELGIDGVILGGTELPLLLGATEIAGLPGLDTTALHVAEIVRRLR